MSAFIDLTGKPFGRLTVLERAPNSPQGRARWTCQCTCGTLTTVGGKELRSGHTTSCGCWPGERTRIVNTTHGMTHTPEYKIFHAMITRCTNPNQPGYKNYGGRGIRVEWTSVEAFMADMGPRPSTKHTIERVDNAGNYSRDNCVWATRDIQANNRRNALRIPYEGHLYTLKQLSMLLGIKRETLAMRWYRHGRI